MDFEYQTRPLIDCAKLLSGGTPSKSNPEYWDGDIPWITPKDMADWNGGTADHVTAAAVGNGTRLAPAFASYIAVRGMSLHNEIRVIRPSFPATFNQDIKAIQALDGVDGRFLYYCLVAHKPTLLDKVESSGHGTGKLPTDQLENLPIPKVDDGIAIAVAKILGDLDDKIDLLREMNRTLEDIAREVFRAWFVDFDPVRAKAAGASSFRGMPQDLFDALPTEFEASAIGEIPKGWDVALVRDVVDLKRDSVQPFDHAEQIYEHFSLPAFDRDQEPDLEKGANIKSGKFAVHEGCLLFSKLNPRIPRIWIPSAPTPQIPQIASTEFLVCVPRSGWSKAFAYFLIKQPKFVEQLSKQATGTSNSHQRIKPSQFEEVALAAPPNDLRLKFDALALPLIRRLVGNRLERTKLSAIRDTLLPKLISGELTPPSLEAIGLKAVGDGG